MNIKYILEQLKKHYIIISLLMILIYLVVFLVPVIDKIKLHNIKYKQYIANKLVILSKQPPKNIYEGLLLNMENNVEIAYNIKIISESCKVKLKKLNFGAKESVGLTNDKIYSIPMQIEITGTLADIVTFTDMVEKKTQLYEIDSLEITPSSEVSDKLNLGKVGIRYYYAGG